MAKQIKFILVYWLCWVLLFDFARLVFILFNTKYWDSKLGWDLVLSLWYGLRMDASMASYITLPVLVLLVISIFFLFFRKLLIYKVYTGIVLFTILFLLFADIGLFAAWGFRLDDTLVRYLSNPGEVWASISHLPLVLIFVGFIIIYAFLILISSKLIGRASLTNLHSPRWHSLVMLLILGAAFIIPLRGGFQLAPLNQSSVYFSQDNFANMAAINAPWNFAHAITHHVDRTSNPFAVTGFKEVDSLKDALFFNQEKTLSLINLKEHPKPNLLIIVWESLTAKALNLSVDQQEVLPGFNKLIQEGIYFSNIYAAGDRTDKGIVAVLSGYPAQPTTSIIKEPGKASKLPALGKIFSDEGYHNSFYYGGELEFANMKAYLLQGGFHRFISKDNFNKKDINSKWGTHDGVVAQRLQQDLVHSPQPFFATWLTLSSHEPYEIPVENAIQGKDEKTKYLRSLHYTDSVVYSFVRNAREQSWWTNSLLVIVADHGHRFPLSNDRSDDFKIPLLLLGGALNSVNKIFEGVGNQTGIPATIAAQLGWEEHKFPFSRNLLDTSARPWAIFSFNNGFGYVQPGKKVIFDNVGTRIIQEFGNVTTEDIKQGRVLQQFFFQDYLDK
jgi:phosphoglycerol transferase MdoB-like AlkP superfamily enzyme